MRFRVIFVVGFVVVFFAHPVVAASLSLWQNQQIGSWQLARPATNLAGWAGPIATGDLGSDGVDETVVGAAPSQSPAVRVLRANGSEIFSFAAFDGKMMSGIAVAIGDVNGDGVAEIVTATGPGVPGEIRIFDNRGAQKGQSIFPYGKNFYGGVSVAAADINGDGIAETFAVPMSDRAVDVLELREDGKVLGMFRPFVDAEKPAHVVTADVDGDGRKDVAVLEDQGGTFSVRVFSGPKFTRIVDISVAQTTPSSAVTFSRVRELGAVSDSLLIGERGSNTTAMTVYDRAGNIAQQFSVPFSVVSAVFGQFGKNAMPQMVVSADDGAASNSSSVQSIRVDLSDQRLVAYQNGRPVRSFLVATGLKKYPTPVGNFSVLAKPFKVLYKKTYGPGNPDNYDFGLVPYNLRIINSGIYIHYAPWRKVFGRRGSHGCVNVDLENAKWIYGWAAIGTPVAIGE